MLICHKLVMAPRRVALGYDEGTVLIKIGREEPVASMDASGKIIWARHNEIQTVNVKALGAEYEDVRRPAWQGDRTYSCLQRVRYMFRGLRMGAWCCAQALVALPRAQQALLWTLRSA